MKESTYQKFASVAAFIVALSSLTYGLVFLPSPALPHLE